MFSRYFADSYFPGRYFPPLEDAQDGAALVVVHDTSGGAPLGLRYGPGDRIFESVNDDNEALALLLALVAA